MLYANRKGLKVIIDSDEIIGVNLSTYILELKLAIEMIENSERKKKEQLVKEHICDCNNIKYVSIRSNQDLYKIIMSVKEVFRKYHIFIQTNDEKDIKFLWEWFLEKRKNLKSIE